MGNLNDIAKAAFDRSVSFVGLLCLSPLLVAVAIAIRLRMPDGPALFRQTRIGQGGRPFSLVKFRTMTAKHGGSTVSIAGDSRVTPLGAFLRRHKLDELPELWNVLKGDMSFVGPRPDVPGYADKLQGKERDILRLKPGITGPATLKYRDEEELLARQRDPVRYNDEVLFPDKVRLNLEYLHNHTFIGDIIIILKTLF